jgi:hypothetical protein
VQSVDIRGRCFWVRLLLLATAAGGGRRVATHTLRKSAPLLALLAQPFHCHCKQTEINVNTLLVRFSTYAGNEREAETGFGKVCYETISWVAMKGTMLCI